MFSSGLWISYLEPPSHLSLLFLTLVNPHLLHESISHCCPPDGCFRWLIVKESAVFYSVCSGRQRWWRAPATLPKRMEMPHPSRDSMPWKDPEGSSSAHSRKYGYSAGRRQGFLWRREKSGLWEWIKGRYWPQEEKIRGKVNKRKGMKGGTCAMRQNEER